ncbi:hypothetical protein F4810DRAFT_691191 [Camillea tinctor]|nr:hypothetical protein F4810DRAFT_691191 [Camillea tinctor]
MAQQTHNSTGLVTVKTNNFHQVLEHFDEQGHIKNPDITIFAIPCQICSQDLAVVNPKFDTCAHKNTTCSIRKHESYVVLPKCGHAFGSWCLLEYFTTQSNITAGCPSPSCGERIVGDFEPKEMFIRFRPNDLPQHDEIMDIRKKLEDGTRSASLVNRGC